MAQRFLGPTGSRRRRRMLIGPTLLMAAVALLLTAGAQAVHDVGVFELEGNAVTDHAGAGLPDDWDRICKAGTAGLPTPLCTSAGAANTAVLSFDVDAPGATIFTGAEPGGQSKDIDDISGWRWKSGSVPDKDELTHGYAAQYTAEVDPDHVGSETLLYFGANRFAQSGDAQIGFWFLQNRVTLVPPASGAVGSFSDVHEIGDLLILSNFTQGGGQPTVRVFEWVGSGGSDGAIDLVVGDVDTPQDCDVVSDDDFCATVNDVGGVTSPWPYTPKSGPANQFPAGALYEGGVNLSSIPEFANRCFSTFLAESRSSAEPNAVLKDFMIGSFAPCEATLVTTPSTGAGGTVTPGTDVTDTAVVLGGGIANPPTPTGNVTFFLCGPIATGTCASGGTQVGSPVSLSDSSPPPGEATAISAAVNTAASPLTPGRYCFRAEWPGDSNYPVALSHAGSGDSECFNVAKIDTNTVTTPVDGSGVETHSITLTQSIRDRAVVTGTAAGGDPTGTVTFFVCGPIASGTCASGGTQVGAAQPLVSDGNPATFTSSATSDPFTPTAVGRYCFRGEYGGSTIYNPSSDSGENECFVVTDTTAITSAQTWLPNDSATLTSANGAPLNGSLSFTLYSGLTCSGTVLRPAESFTLSNAASPVQRSTTNSTVSVTVTSDVSWGVVFTSTDPNVSSSSKCETSSLTITN